MPRFVPGFVKRGWASVGSGMIRWLREWTRPNSKSLVSGAVADATRSKSELMLENALLRQQLIVLDRQAKRPLLSWRERGIMVLLASKLRHWKNILLIVQPDTVLRWHRDWFRWVWRRKSQP
jgi:putative transposase